MLALGVPRVVEAVHRGREVMHVIRNAMRLEHRGRVLDDVGPECELTRHVELPWVPEQRGICSFWEARMPLRGRHLDVRQPRVRVLRVVHRVFAALRAGHLEVETYRGVRGPEP